MIARDAAVESDVLLLGQVMEYRSSLVKRVAALERKLPTTGNELRPYCEVFLALDHLKWALEDLGAAAQ